MKISYIKKQKRKEEGGQTHTEAQWKKTQRTKRNES